MKMKRVLIRVEEVNGCCYGWGMESAVNKILRDEFRASMFSTNDYAQEIFIRGMGAVVATCPPQPWLPKHIGNCPPEFVLELPAYLVRKGVPSYTGPVKGEAR